MKKQRFIKILVTVAILVMMLGMLASCAMLQGPQGEQGTPGNDGKDGETPTISISEDGYWVINGVKTEYKAIGTDGKDGTDGKPGADGEDGVDGTNGTNGVDGATPTIEISEDGYWVINGVKTEYKAAIQDDHEHSFSQWKILNENSVFCEDALFYRICSDCHDMECKDGTEEDHTYVPATTAPTCTSIGYDTKTCSTCGKSVVHNETPVTDHTYPDEYVGDKSFHWKKCNTCDKMIEQQEHTLGDDCICTVCDMPIDTVGVIYEISEDGTYYEVAGYSGNETRIRIAEEYNGLPVKTIKQYAFNQNTNIVSVIISDSVTTIGTQAFGECNKLESITIGNGVTAIGKSAFYYCSKLTSVTIPDSVTLIDDGAFTACSGLESVIIGNGVTTIGTQAFFSCKNLTSVTIGNGVTSIESDAFYVCDKLTNVYITDMAAWFNIEFGGTTSNPIRYAKNFYLNGEPVTDLVIPDGVTVIKTHAFYECDSITSLTVPDSVTEIGSEAFYYCSNLTNVTIGNGVTTIGKSAFRGCSGLESVIIGKGVSSIFGGAFQGCSGLTSVTIGSDVVFIESDAFSNCNANLYTEYEYGRYIGDSENPYQILYELTDSNKSTYNIHEDTRIIVNDVFYSCYMLKSITIPDNVTTIGTSAFSYCERLTNVTISDSVIAIGAGAFRYCSVLKNVYFAGTADEWSDIEIRTGNVYLTDATIYYYSETEPTEVGNFWHYDESGKTVAW